MGLFLGIDLGTSYFKAALFDTEGMLRGFGRQPLKKESGDGILCELPLPVFWKTIHSCVRKAMRSAGVNAGQVLALSYSSQANSFLLLDCSLEPLTPLILWPDKRAEGFEPPERMSPGNSEFLMKTGLGIELGFEFCLAKINWFRKEQPGIWERTCAIHSISDHLTFTLTGQKLSDTSTASLTGLLDTTGCSWWEGAFEAFSLETDFFSAPRRTGSPAGTLTASGAKLIGLTPGIPYYLGGLDHHCAAIGSGIIQNNHLCESTGTVLACVGYSNDYVPEIKRFVAPGLSPGDYFQMAFDNNGAHSLEWYRENFAASFSIPELIDMAQKVERGCGGLVGRPSAYKYPDLSGFVNRRSMHTHGHFVRAILESTANSLADLINSMNNPCSGQMVISTGGGARSSIWIQIKADTLNKVFLIPECTETACMGAALIAARGEAQLGDWAELIKNWVRFRETVQPGSIKPTH